MIGESATFKSPSLNYLGNIYAGKENDSGCEVKLFAIKRFDMERIPYFERG